MDPHDNDGAIPRLRLCWLAWLKTKRTIPKGSEQSNDFGTKKIFIGARPSSVTENELKDFFSKYGSVVEHEIIRDHITNQSLGFGFVIFHNEEVVDKMLSKGNMIDMEGAKDTMLDSYDAQILFNAQFLPSRDILLCEAEESVQVEIKKAEPKKPSNPPPSSGYGRKSRANSVNDGFGGCGYGGSYEGFDGGYVPGPGPGPYRTPEGLGGGEWKTFDHKDILI